MPVYDGGAESLTGQAKWLVPRLAVSPDHPV